MAVIGDAVFSASMARCLFYDFNMRPIVIGLRSDSQIAIDRGKQLLEEMGRYCDFDIYENPTFFEYGQAINKTQPYLAIGDGSDKMMVISENIPHVCLGGFRFMGRFNFVPWPIFGVRGILGLLTELSMASDSAKHESAGYSKQSYIHLLNERKEARDHEEVASA